MPLAGGEWWLLQEGVLRACQAGDTLSMPRRSGKNAVTVVACRPGRGHMPESVLGVIPLSHLSLDS